MVDLDPNLRLAQIASESPAHAQALKNPAAITALLELSNGERQKERLRFRLPDSSLDEFQDALNLLKEIKWADSGVNPEDDEIWFLTVRGREIAALLAAVGGGEKPV